MDRTLRILEYNREKARQYALRWAYGRNPKYFDFENYGGDCTNFASQCIYAGCGVMNYKYLYGWYYINANNRTPSWTGVDYLYNFLVGNTDVGPFSRVVNVSDIKVGDIIQLSFQESGPFQHSPVVVSTGNPPDLKNIRVAAHTDNQSNYPVLDYGFTRYRCINIAGYRSY